MHLELVQTTTPDGLRLWGALGQAPGQAASRLVICLHGVASNFYASSLMQSLGESLNQEGLDVLRVNTRGHDNCCTTFATCTMRLRAALACRQRARRRER